MLKVMYRVIDGLRPWSGQFVPGYGIISNGNFTDEQIKILELSGLKFTVTDTPPPAGLDLVNQGFVPPAFPEQLDGDGWEERTGKVPGGPVEPVAVLVPVPTPVPAAPVVAGKPAPSLPNVTVSVKS